MRRIALIAATAVTVMSLSACGSTTNDFTIENGLCYRLRTEKTLGVQTYKQKVLAVPANCGL